VHAPLHEKKSPTILKLLVFNPLSSFIDQIDCSSFVHTTLFDSLFFCFFSSSSALTCQETSDKPPPRNISKQDLHIYPLFNSLHAASRLYCPSLQANLHYGGVVLFDDGRGQERIGRVVDLSDPYQVKPRSCPLVDYSRFTKPPVTDDVLSSNLDIYTGRQLSATKIEAAHGVAFLFSQE
jgi:hypothetical protein